MLFLAESLSSPGMGNLRAKCGSRKHYMACIRILVTQFRVQDCVKNKHRDKQFLRQ